MDLERRHYRQHATYRLDRHDRDGRTNILGDTTPSRRKAFFVFWGSGHAAVKHETRFPRPNRSSV